MHAPLSRTNKSRSFVNIYAFWPANTSEFSGTHALTFDSTDQHSRNEISFSGCRTSQLLYYVLLIFYIAVSMKGFLKVYTVVVPLLAVVASLSSQATAPFS